jgi:hypothetical protein
MATLRQSIFVAACLLVCCESAGDQWEEKVDDQGRKVQSMQIQAPAMTEEDQYGYTMPPQYRCDSCKVVTYHLGEALKQRQPKNRRLKEWEYAEIFDETCQGGFKGYGVALVDGQNMLSGPAIKRDNLEPGMGAIQMGGETWEKRLGEICRTFVYDKIGEDEVYEHFRAKGGVSEDLCFSETRDCQRAAFGPKALPSEKKTPSEKKEKRGESAVELDIGKAANIDMSAFISKLAKKHGVAKSEYTRKRSFAEWEQLLTQVAQRIEQPKNDGQTVDV